MKPDIELLTVKQTATRLNLPYRQVLEATNNGQIPYYQIGKSRRMLNIHEVLSSIIKNERSNHEN